MITWQTGLGAIGVKLRLARISTGLVLSTPPASCHSVLEGVAMNMTQLTSRQKEVFEFVRDLITNRGYGPTVREIGDKFGISSPNGVMCHLKALEKKGL